MSSSYIFWPVLAQVFLTLAMFIFLGARKARAVKAGQVNRKQAALDNRVWPEDVLKVANNIANQFEVPVLFYVPARMRLFMVGCVMLLAMLVLSAWNLAA